TRRSSDLALCHRGNTARNFGSGPEQIIDECVDGIFHRAPGAGAAITLYALAGLALASNHLTDPIELGGNARVCGNDVVEGIGNLAFYAGPVTGKTNNEVTIPDCLQCSQQCAGIVDVR